MSAAQRYGMQHRVTGAETAERSGSGHARLLGNCGRCSRRQTGSAYHGVGGADKALADRAEIYHDMILSFNLGERASTGCPPSDRGPTCRNDEPIFPGAHHQAQHQCEIRRINDFDISRLDGAVEPAYAKRDRRSSPRRPDLTTLVPQVSVRATHASSRWLHVAASVLPVAPPATACATVNGAGGPDRQYGWPVGVSEI